MTIKDKLKSYNFWISIISAIVLIVRIVGDKFNFFVDTSLIMDIATGVCSVLVILGILYMPKAKKNTQNDSPSEEQSITLKPSISAENSLLIDSTKALEQQQCDVIESSEQSTASIETLVQVDTRGQEGEDSSIIESDTSNVSTSSEAIEQLIVPTNSCENDLQMNKPTTSEVHDELMMQQSRELEPLNADLVFKSDTKETNINETLVTESLAFETTDENNMLLKQKISELKLFINEVLTIMNTL